MIVPMKKLSLLIFHKDYEPFLEDLRELGVVHIHENTERCATDEQLREKLQIIRRINDMKQRLSYRTPDEHPADPKASGASLLELLECKYQQIEQNEQLLSATRKDLSIYNLWGDFSQERIENIKKAGWDVRFFATPDNVYRKEWEEQYDLFLISETGGHKYFVVIALAEDQQAFPEADPFVFPSTPAHELEQRLQKAEEEIRDINAWLDTVAPKALDLLEDYRLHILEDADHIKVVTASNPVLEEKVMALEGWVPKDRLADLNHFLQQRDVYFEVNNSTPADDVPTKLKNGKFSRLFEPIGEMYSLPNYSELDLTPFFAPFFMLFFGMCMGDGGYGLLILLACLLLVKKLPEGMKNYARLGAWLGGSTVVVGLLTGSFFGMALDSVTWPWLQGVKHYFLTEGNYGQYFGGYNPLMFISFGLGIIQILIAMTLNVIKITKQHGFKYAVSSLGWLVALIASMICFGLPALGVTLPTILTYALYGAIGISALFIFFMNSPQKNIFINFGSGIWDAYNMVSGLLGDILSYVRLFALGLTGSILGGVFNMIAFDMTTGIPPSVRFIVIFLILIIGHSLNFAIAMIGALVHPMRLTFVEFYKNAGFEGMGKKYEPFSKRINK